MKKSLKLTLSILMVVAMLATTLPLTIFAAGTDVCKIGDVGYSSVADAVAAASDGAVINVIKDTACASGLSITKNLTITSANGSVITIDAKSITVDAAVELQLTGNLVIRKTTTADCSVAIVNATGATLTIDGATLESVINGMVNINQAGTLNVKSGYLNCKNTGGNGGAIGIGKDGAVVNVSGGTIESANVCAIRNKIKANTTNVNISGGTIKAKTVAIGGAYNGEAAWGIYNITGGTITAESKTIHVGAGELKISSANVLAPTNILATNGDTAIFSNTYSNPASNGSVVTITGGTISSTGALTIYHNAATTLTVGGTAKVTAGTNGAIYMSNDSANSIVNITGGEISAVESRAIRKAVTNAVVNISGGKVTSATETIGGYNSGIGNGIYGTLNITGGTVEATGACAVAMGNATVTISGDARVKAGSDTIWINKDRKNTLNITDGTVSATNSSAILVNYTVESGKNDAQSVVIDGGLVEAASNTIILYRESDLTINGGKIAANGATVIAAYGNSTSAPNVTVNGGTIIQNGSGTDNLLIQRLNDTTVVLNGGLFINNNPYNKTMFNEGIVYNAGKCLYLKNTDAIISGLVAPKTSTAAYDHNLNGIADEDEIYYFYSRNEATDSGYAGIMEDGASVRLNNGGNGLRFNTVFSSDVVAALEAKGSVTYGHIILPTAYLALVNKFTKAELDAANIPYLNVVAQNGIYTDDNGNVTVYAAISDILPENYDRAYSAIGYALVGGQYYYTAYDEINNSRSIDFVVREALDDLKTAEEGEYINVVTAYGRTLYSPYTEAERAILERYIAVTLNVPKPAGSTLINSGNGCYQYYASSVESDTYTAYKNSLVAAGFAEASETTIENNIYTTYSNNKQIVTLTYTPNTEEMRVLMESAKNTSLIVNEAYTAPAQTVETTVTQLGQWYVDTTTKEHKHYPDREDDWWGNIMGYKNDYATNYNAGMGYVIRLEDGSFIIIDGGYNTETHADNLYDVLYKQSPSGEIVIAAWIFTHADSDHVGAFRAFTAKYAKNVTVERFIYNFPTEEAAQFALPVEGVSTGSPALTPVINAMNKYPDAVVTIAHTGQVFNIRNAKINILFTYEMMQPHNLSYYNSCSIVFNMELEEKTLLFLGDAGGNSTTGTPLADMMEIYTSETLDADIVQVAHHGIDVADATDDFYELLTPDYLLVPCASEYTMVGDKYVRLAECSAYKTLTSGTKYLAGSSVTVLTIDNGSVLAQTYDDVSAYKNSTGG